MGGAFGHLDAGLDAGIVGNRGGDGQRRFRPSQDAKDGEEVEEETMKLSISSDSGVELRRGGGADGDPEVAGESGTAGMTVETVVQKSPFSSRYLRLGPWRGAN